MGGELEGFEAGGENASEKQVVKRRRGGQPKIAQGWVKQRLVKDLALGEKTHRQLAERYGVVRETVQRFARDNRLEIEHAREMLGDAYAGLWIAQKENRVAEYQVAAEKMSEGDSPRHAEVLVNVLKAVADEMGDLPQRASVQVNNTEVRYEVHGVDPEALR